jgi:[ribosomal protein S18]-alanine N-acetyltransferase
MAAVPRPPDLHVRFAIRDLARHDLPNVAAIEQSAYEFPWTLGNFRDSFDSGYTLIGAFAGHELAGYAIIMYAVDEAHLLNVAVAPAFQGQGLGRHLLRHIIERVSVAQSQMLYLEVRPSNANARALYASLGFRQIAIRPNYYPARNGREDALFLGLRLA